MRVPENTLEWESSSPIRTCITCQGEKSCPLPGHLVVSLRSEQRWIQDRSVGWEAQSAGLWPWAALNLWLDQDRVKERLFPDGIPDLSKIGRECHGSTGIDVILGRGSSLFTGSFLGLGGDPVGL